MNILALDTCFDACSVAILRAAAGGGWDEFARFEPMQTGHAEQLIPMIAGVLDDAGLELAAIARLGVTVGPGTFAGSRIGISAAKALALDGSIKAIGLTSLAAIAMEAAGIERSAACICVAVDARRGEAYTQLFSTPGLSELTPAAVLSIDDAAGRAIRAAGPGPMVVAGSAAELVAAGLALRGARPPLRVMPDLKSDARFAARLVSQNYSHIYATSPLYFRAPDAKPSASTVLLQRF